MKFLNNKKFVMVLIMAAIVMVASLMLSQIPDILGFIFLAFYGISGFVVCMMLGAVVCQMFIELVREGEEKEVNK